MSVRRIWAKKALDLGKIYAFDVLKRLRAAAVKTPILILSVKAEPDDRVKGARLTNEVQFLYDRELQWEQTIVSSI